MMQLGMVDNEDFSELLSGSATFYDCDFADLVCENLNSERQIDMLIMVFANSVEDKLTWVSDLICFSFYRFSNLLYLVEEIGW